MLLTSFLFAVAPFAAVAGSGEILDPNAIPKFVAPLYVPRTMPSSGVVKLENGKAADYYKVAVRQITQDVLPTQMGLAPTKVWAYGSVDDASSFHYPGDTFEARYQRPVRVQWINELKDGNGHFLPHLFAIDPTLHWANPGGGTTGRDMRPDFTGLGTPDPYGGPVPIVIHLHGANTTEESDGFPEAWFLPDAVDVPSGFAHTGTYYDYFSAKHHMNWTPGSSTYTYPNDQRATTLWYHDHVLGMTRANVYAGLAGFYLLRGGPRGLVKGNLPEGAYDIPLMIQDRSFTTTGGLFYPSDRAYFEGVSHDQLQIPFIPDPALGDPSDISPYWNPEFFGNTIVVNGTTWPSLDVEKRRYRFRFLNACDARFLILGLSDGSTMYQIGSDGGLLPAVVARQTLLIAPAERVDVVVDFTSIPAGTDLYLTNIGPDEPFGGGVPGVDFASADPKTTGLVMKLHVVAAKGRDKSDSPTTYKLPKIDGLGASNVVRQLLIEEDESATVFVTHEADGSIVFDPTSSEAFAPRGARLGTIDSTGTPVPMMWEEPISENPDVGSVETWEIHNTTVDAHPIHVHLVQFQILERIDADGVGRGPEDGETGWKDTVIAYPGEITRIQAKFSRAGLYVWHCHILEHEDNEMMRPYHVGPIPPDLPMQ